MGLKGGLKGAARTFFDKSDFLRDEIILGGIALPYQSLQVTSFLRFSLRTGIMLLCPDFAKDVPLCRTNLSVLLAPRLKEDRAFYRIELPCVQNCVKIAPITKKFCTQSFSSS